MFVQILRQLNGQSVKHLVCAKRLACIIILFSTYNNKKGRKMRKKFKMELINNYVDIYKILFNCKELIKTEKNTDQEKIISLLHDALKLKNEYEKMFDILKMNDISFLVLKRDLDNAMKFQPQNYSPSSLEKILELKGKAEKDLRSLHEQA